MTPRLKAYLYLLGSTIIWGVAGPVIKFTLDGIDPFPFLSYRLFVSAIIGVASIAIFRPKIPSKPKDYINLIFYSLLATTFALGFLFLGLDRTTVLEAGLIGAIGPLAVIAGGAMLLKERITKTEKIGILIAFSGTLFTVISPIFLGHNGVQIGGNILLLLFLITDASSILLAKSLLKRKFDPLLMTSFAFIIGAITIIPFTFLSFGTTEVISSIIEMPLKYHLGVWYMAAVSGTIAYFIFMKGVRLIEASEAILFSYLQPIFSVPLAVIWLGEAITPVFVIGAAIITMGVYIAEKRKH